MLRSTWILAAALCLGSSALAWSQDKKPESPRKPPDGVYAVQRDSLNEKEVLPLKDGEVLIVDQHRYVKKEDKEPPRYLVVRSAPEVDLDLVGEPKAIKKGDEVTGILLKLKPKAATDLERLTRDQLGKQITIVLSGEVVTMHKVRGIIKEGDVQITSCAPGAAGYLLEQLQAQLKKK